MRFCQFDQWNPQCSLPVFLKGNILGRGNSKLDIGSKSKYLTLYYRKAYSFIMTLGNVAIYSS
jgi:hypothetical protein